MSTVSTYNRFRPAEEHLRRKQSPKIEAVRRLKQTSSYRPDYNLKCITWFAVRLFSVQLGHFSVSLYCVFIKPILQLSQLDPQAITTAKSIYQDAPLDTFIVHLQ